MQFIRFVARTTVVVFGLLMVLMAVAFFADNRNSKGLLTAMLAVLAFWSYRRLKIQAVAFRSARHLDFHTKLVGVTYENDDGTSRQRLLRRCRKEQALLVIRDPGNKYDRNAVMVCTKGSFFSSPKQLGFLSRDVAAEIAPMIDRGENVRVTVSDVTGGGGGFFSERKNLGLNLRITVN